MKIRFAVTPTAAALTTTNDLDLVEGLDFYEWLDAHQSAAG